MAAVALRVLTGTTVQICPLPATIPAPNATHATAGTEEVPRQRNVSVPAYTETIMATTPASSMAAAVLDARLRIRRPSQPPRPFAPTTFDTELMHATHRAITTNTPLAVVMPLPGLHAPILLAAAAVVAAVARTGNLNVRVGVAQKALTARQTYDQLFMREQNLSEFIPRARIHEDGTAVTVGDTPGSGCVDIATDYDRLARSTSRYDAVLIDASTITPAQTRSHLAHSSRPPTVFLTADPCDPVVAAVRNAGGVVWGWNPASLAALARPAIATPTATAGPVFCDAALLAGPADASVTVVAGANHDGDAALHALRAHVRELGATYSSNGIPFPV